MRNRLSQRIMVLSALFVLHVVLFATPAPAPAQNGGLPLPLVTADMFTGSGNCALCHSRLTDQAGNDVSNDAQWRSTMMANAARDPYFQAKVSSEIQRAPALKAVIEDVCATCHLPMGRTEAAADGETAVLLGDGMFDPANDRHSLGMDGVSCALCHQIQEEGLGTPDTFSGAYPIDLITQFPERIMYGPYPDPQDSLMRSSTGYISVEGPHLGESRMCAACHTLYTPYLNDAGEVAGTFPEQTIFLEWQHSGYRDSASCQGCHMPAAEGGVVISILPPGLPEREPFSQHHFVGGNRFMVDLINLHGGELGVTASTDHFAATRGRIEDQMQTRAAWLSIDSSVAVGDTLETRLSVGAMTGHKFPAGFPARRAWIHFTVTDAAGAAVFESGRPLADGRIEGNGADETFKTVEPHYDVITTPDQAQIYESAMNDVNGGVTYTLLRASGYLKDNRLLPAGFDKAAAGADFSVKGAAAGDANFTAGRDEIVYQANIAGTEGPYTVEAELLYQAVAYPFVEDFRSVDTEEVNAFLRMFEATPKDPVFVASDAEGGIERSTAVPDWRLGEPGL